MDQLLAPLLLLEEGIIVLISIGLIIVGGIAAALFVDVKIEIGRLAYLWFLALSGLALTCSQFIWILTPIAAEFGLLSILIIIGMGFFVVFGAANYYASAARSRDICGRKTKAWIGFVPVANLWLVFKEGAAAADHDDETEDPASRAVPDLIMVIGALAIIALTKYIEKSVDNIAYYDPNDSKVLIDLLSNAQSVEENFALEAKQIGRASCRERC